MVEFTTVGSSTRLRLETTSRVQFGADRIPPEPQYNPYFNPVKRPQRYQILTLFHILPPNAVI